MKDVLLINYTGRKGGGPLDAYEMTRELINRGFPVVAILSDQIENLDMWKDLRLEKLVTIPTYNSIKEYVMHTLLFSVKQKRTIIKELAEYNIKYIYCPMGARWTKKINKIFPLAKKGIVIHDPMPHSGDEIKNFFLEEDYSRYDNLFVHSKQFIDYVREKYNKPTDYIKLGTHGIYKYCKNKEEVIQYDEAKINFLFFGRISPYKGLDVLATAYKKVSEKLGENVTLSIIGSGNFSPYAKQYEGLKNVTVINRWIKDEETESAFLGKNLICLCPYTDATQSGVVILAMDYGIPIIASNAGGVSEQIEDGETGLLVAPSDADSLAEAMIKMATDSELRNKISLAQKQYMTNMGWEIGAEQLVNAMKIDL